MLGLLLLLFFTPHQELWKAERHKGTFFTTDNGAKTTDLLVLQGSVDSRESARRRYREAKTSRLHRRP